MRARKRFGQHFLTSEAVLDQLASAIRPGQRDLLLEIGPGFGALTALLYGTTQRYVAIEIDRDLIAGLKASYPKLELLNIDVLKAPLREIFEGGSWRVVGNLPYNISSPLLMALFEQLDQIEDMHFMFQRELGLRLGARPGTKSWGRLSVMTQYHCRVESLFDVAPEAFTPAPKVHSQVVRLVPRQDKPDVDIGQLNVVLRMAFSARRKRLGNALKSLDIRWDELGIADDLRPDQLDVEQFVAIANATSGVFLNQDE